MIVVKLGAARYRVERLAVTVGKKSIHENNQASIHVSLHHDAGPTRKIGAAPG